MNSGLLLLLPLLSDVLAVLFEAAARLSLTIRLTCLQCTAVRSVVCPCRATDRCRNIFRDGQGNDGAGADIYVKCLVRNTSGK